ncbi:hypothetical protein BMS3Bbin07_00733 [bacterium BMS3Bbin07]|nr:hypothetical protein BMS3Bbin07_00733 [bacterium BMS3Bbin07]
MIIKWVMITLLSVIVMLSFINFYQNVIQYEPVRTPNEKNEPSNMKKKKPLMPEKGWIEDILSHNIFSPARSYKDDPGPVTEVEIVQAPLKQPELILKGVILNQYNVYIAYIEKDGQKAIGVRSGDKIGDIEVMNISNQSVMLKWNAETITLTLKRVESLNKKKARRR